MDLVVIQRVSFRSIETQNIRNGYPDEAADQENALVEVLPFL
jgi:hypothetical protein